MVGAPYSVGGFFSSLKKAVSGAVKKVVPKAIQRAASKVVRTAKRAVSAVSRVPVLGSVLQAAANVTRAGAGLMLLPAVAATQLLDGKRIDRIAIDSLKRSVRDARTVAPYVQTVISVVPGVGTGISAGLGGALALAEGQSITAALEQAVKSSIPGGPLAQAAFSVASGVMQGKPLDQVALNALPLGAAEKSALSRGLLAAKALASGKRVDQVLLDQALRSLPPTVQKAVQIGTAIGHAKNLQGALGAAAHGAAQLASSHAAGLAAARAYQSGVRTPAILDAMRRAHASKAALATIVRHANNGHPQAAHIVRALQHASSRPTAPMPPRPSFGGLRPPSVNSFGFLPRPQFPMFAHR
jgi:hypothetical protein